MEDSLTKCKMIAAAIFCLATTCLVVVAVPAAERRHSVVARGRCPLLLRNNWNRANDLNNIHRRSNDDDLYVDPAIFKDIFPPLSVQDVVTVDKTSVINPIADFIVRVIKRGILKRGMETITIPDINEISYKGVGPLKVKAAFNASHGWFRNLASLQRTKDVVATRSGDKVILVIGVGLRTMVVGYEKYVAKFGFLKLEGNISGTVSNNSLTIKLSVDVEDHRCNLSLLDLTIDLLGKIKVELTGMGKLNWMYSKIVSWVANHYNYKIIPLIEKTLREHVQELFGRLRCENDQPEMYK